LKRSPARDDKPNRDDEPDKKKDNNGADDLIAGETHGENVSTGVELKPSKSED
jgi:hypothetical protein